MASRFQGSTSLRLPPVEVLSVLVQVMTGCGLTVSTVDPVQGVLFATRGRGVPPCGEQVTVEVGQASGDDVTQVQMTATKPFGWLRPSRSRETVETVLAALLEHRDVGDSQP